MEREGSRRRRLRDQLNRRAHLHGVARLREPDGPGPQPRTLLTEGEKPDFTDDGEFAPDDNNYQITVSATEMRAGADAPLPAKRTDIALTVIVGNADDTGELTLQWLQPEVGTAITATLTDPDGDTTGAPSVDVVHLQGCRPRGWQFVPLDRITTGATLNSYTPAAADEGKYLWVHVEYTDPQWRQDRGCEI